MLTLHKNSETIHIADLFDSAKDKNPQPIFWHPKKNKDLKLGVDDVEPYLKSAEFRNYYHLHPNAAKLIADALLKDRPLDEKTQKSIQTKYWTVKKDLEKKLYTEMDLAGSDQFIRLDFP